MVPSTDQVSKLIFLFRGCYFVLLFSSISLAMQFFTFIPPPKTFFRISFSLFCSIFFSKISISFSFTTELSWTPFALLFLPNMNCSVYLSGCKALGNSATGLNSATSNWRNYFRWYFKHTMTMQGGRGALTVKRQFSARTLELTSLWTSCSISHLSGKALTNSGMKKGAKVLCASIEIALCNRRDGCIDQVFPVLSSRRSVRLTMSIMHTLVRTLLKLK